ncbi:POK25 protein, partial [Aegithalos caudatus]|nr:POK25 protein [Aegithalos caudatus]
LTWRTDKPMWLDTWPLPEEKLVTLESLVQEQLCKGHLTSTTSPWNTPVFVIQEQNKGKWQFLQDLCKINEVMEDMGTLQLGLPLPVIIPKEWKLIVIDLKDCFFDIPLHPDDAPQFVFSIPSVNRQAPLQIYSTIYHWTVLPQGTKNSPTICQRFVAKVLIPVCEEHPQAIIYHYMDDIFIAVENNSAIDAVLKATVTAIQQAGLTIAGEKIQQMPPWKYLGLKILPQAIQHQPLQLNENLQTLHDLQKLLGTINWVGPLLGITNEDLAPLFVLLKGDPVLNSSRQLTDKARDALDKVSQAVQTHQAHRKNPNFQFLLAI